MIWAVVIISGLVLLFTFACLSVGADADRDPTTIEPPMGERQ